MHFASKQFKRPGNAFIASLLVCLVLLLDAMAASPALHELIHSDATRADHQCAVTVFAHGQVDSAIVDVVAVVPVAPAEFLPTRYVSIISASVDTLPPGRAPPASLLHS